MKILKVTTTILLCLAAMVLLGVYFIQDKLLFYPEKLDRSFVYTLTPNDKEVSIKTADGETINGLLYHREQNKHVVLYFHGNAGSLNSWQQISEQILPLADLLIIDYRGYGKSTGSISESGFYKDADASYQYLISAGYKPEQIIVYGRSIGTGVATELATKQKVAGLILESPYTSLTKLAAEKAPYFLPWITLKYKFDNLKKVPTLKVPVLLLHGKEDELIPYQHSEALYNAITAHKDLVLINGGHHNDLGDLAEHGAALSKFISELP